MKKLWAGLTALVLISGGSFLASPAFADDVTPVEEIVTAEVVETETVPAEEVPAPPAEVARTNNTHPPVKLDPFCHSGNGTNYEWIQPANEGQLNGHKHHEADIFGGTEAECFALNLPPVEEPPAKVKQIALYCYDKLSDAPASWENSGLQTLAAVKDGDVDWTDAEKRELCAAPVEDCEPRLAASQSDWVEAAADFTFPEHIQYPTDNIGWPPIYKAHHTDLTQIQKDCKPVIVPKECETRTVLPTATNLNHQGWTLTNGEWVDGGIEFSAANWSEAYAYLPVNYPLSHAATLDFDSSGPGIFAIILETSGGQYIHYEPVPYTDPLWTNAAGILPANGGGQGGTYSGTLYDLESDPTIVGVYAYYTSGSEFGESGILHSVSAFCYQQNFDFENAELPEPWTDSTEWVDGEYDCDDTTVEQTRTSIDYTYSNGPDGEVIEHEGEPYQETQTRDLTAEEIAAKDATEECAPEVEEPPMTVPPVTPPTTTKLPTAGTDSLGWLIGGALTLLLGIGAVTGRRIRFNK